MPAPMCSPVKPGIEAETTSEQSVAGTIAAGARQFTISLTPLQRDVNYVVRALLAIAIFLLVLVLLSSVIWAYPIAETVVGAAVILGIVPSGLFLMITVTYSMGALRLARKNALVQQVNAVESLSNVDVFCADKTGTLTANKLVLTQIQPIGKFSDDEVRGMLGNFAASVPAGNKTNEAIGAALPGAGATAGGAGAVQLGAQMECAFRRYRRAARGVRAGRARNARRVDRW